MTNYSNEAAICATLSTVKSEISHLETIVSPETMPEKLHQAIRLLREADAEIAAAAKARKAR